nr:flagellar type III secretion system pore protein FliP [Gemmatimonadaceae bacterium]
NGSTARVPYRAPNTDWLRQVPAAGARRASTPAHTPRATPTATPLAIDLTPPSVAAVSPRHTPVAMPSAAMLAQLPAPLVMPTPLMVPAIAESPRAPRPGSPPAPAPVASRRTAAAASTSGLPTLAEIAARRTGALDDAFAAAERVAAPNARPEVPSYVHAAVAMRETTREARPRSATVARTEARTELRADVRSDARRQERAEPRPEPRDSDGAIARASAADQAFGDALRLALRGVAMLALTALTLVAPRAAQAQGAAAPRPVATPAPTPATTVGPATTPTTLPARVTPESPDAGFRAVPAGAARPGPRDLPQQRAAQAPAPRPDRPARTAAQGGGVPTIAPLVPAPQAAGIAAERAQAAGRAPLTTAEAQRMQRRADSALAAVAPTIDLQFGKSAGGEGLRLSGTVGVVVMMGLLSLLPLLLLMMTAFTRIMVVLSFLKQALGTQGTPPGQLIAALALVLSGFVMAPTLREVNSTALEPWMEGRIEQVEMMQRAVVPFRTFMLAQVGDKELQTFVDLSEGPQPTTREEVPLTVLMSAFVTSELRTAFQIGFALFLPFIVVDVVVSSVLMSMGMMMLPPAMVSLPFKLLLFVLVDGWSLVVTGLVQGFR